MSWTKAPRPAKQYTGTNPASPRAPAERIVDGKARMVVPLPKDAPLRSEPYRRWVASLACIHCGREGSSQAGHSDTGKGAGIKSCDSTVIPLCSDGPGRQGCHSMFGASGMLSQAQRRHLESTYVRAVQERADDEGHWPKGWPVELIA